MPDLELRDHEAIQRRDLAISNPDLVLIVKQHVATALHDPKRTFTDK